MNFEQFKEKDMINKIYNAQEKKIDERLKKTDKKLKEKLQKIELKRIIEDSNCPKETKKLLDKIEDNYNIRITEYNKEIYKQGFIDGVNMILNCLKG